MFDVFRELKGHISTSGATQARVSSLLLFTSKLCMLITLLACVLVTAKNYIGDNIKCITGFEKQEHKAIETYCFIASTFTMVDLHKGVSPHPGVGPVHTQTSPEGEPVEGERRVHAYYQWVPMVLVLQAVAYYFPIWAWKRIDRGFFETIICQLDKVHIGEVTQNIQSSVQFFGSSLNTHRTYAINFLLCECAAFAISVGNLFFTNTFLGGEFFQFGPAALKYLNSDATDPSNPLNQIFPKVAKCTWHKFGPSGTIQVHDSMCVLPLNIVNEKTYIFLWVIYIFTAAICGVLLLLNLMLFIMPGVRNALLLYKVRKHETKINLQHILQKCNYGDWFLLFHFQKNMVYYKEWLARARDEVQK
ncbi:Innexin inx2 [Chionoecetes opilio]|uniref:Innexin n=1 Tax=Chionoecetes opilio TaxID=41210 RepID=A0A8J5CGR1_CHIOP|nr:Innexin inx2 [Chionoecetes opilio]